MDKNQTAKGLRKNSTLIALGGMLLVMLILVLGTIWMGQAAKKSSEASVETVSHLYLDELAGRREQVVADNLKGRIQDMDVALEMIEPGDLKDEEHLQEYQAKMKKFFHLEKFAFVDEDGVIHTSMGLRYDIDRYSFDFHTIKGAEISIKNLKQKDKTVIIAQPVDLNLAGKKLVACFEEISMEEMLSGVSMHSRKTDATFSNIYTSTGVALTDQILGGLAVEDNLLEAMKHADYLEGYSYEKVCDDFANLKKGESEFTYDGIRETLSYAPIEGTDWMLTYLIRESVITDRISAYTNGMRDHRQNQRLHKRDHQQKYPAFYCDGPDHARDPRVYPDTEQEEYEAASGDGNGGSRSADEAGRTGLQDLRAEAVGGAEPGTERRPQCGGGGEQSQDCIPVQHEP